MAAAPRILIAGGYGVFGRLLARELLQTTSAQVVLAGRRGNTVTAPLEGAGQRLAILPCALAREGLLSGDLRERGIVHPSTWLAPSDWWTRLQIRGIAFSYKTGQR